MRADDSLGMFGASRLNGDVIESASNEVGLDVGQIRHRVEKTVAAGGPNRPELAVDGGREGPASYEDLIRAAKDVNKEFTNYIRDRLTIVVSDNPAPTQFRHLIGKHKQRIVLP